MSILQRTSAAVRSDRRAGPMHEKAERARVGWLFATPFLVIFVVFTGVPALMALVFSLTDITGRDVRDPFSVDFVFFDTFARVLTNSEFLRSLVTTGIFVVVGVPVTMLLGFVLALALNTRVRRLRSTFRAIFYLPVITNVVAAAVIWQYGFTLNGPLNSALASIGITGPNWLGDSQAATGTVILLAVWRNAGTCMVLFLAGMQAIPEDVYEAAALDGTSAWRGLFTMTLPLLQPATLLVTVLMTVSYMNLFDEPYLLTAGGPVGSTTSVALWVYQQFGYGNVADAMAGSYILLAIIVALGVVQLRLLRSRA